MKQFIDKRVAREEKAHDGGGVLEESYKLKNRFHHIGSYPSRKRLDNYKYELLANIKGLSILDYGCGWGENSIEYYLAGGNVTGIDISGRFINTANESFGSKGFDSERYKFIKMDAHKLQFDDESFDFVVGDGILHHLDAGIALSEIYRVLKPGGKVILFEPLAGHPLLKLFRLLTPQARTVDEAPLTAHDLRTYPEQKAWSPAHTFCGVLEAPVAMVTSVLIPSKPDNLILRVTDKLEKWMIKNKLLLSWNQYVLLVFIK